MIVDKLSSISFNVHLAINVAIRLALIVYGEVQDTLSEVPYTDIDYKVVSDGARHILAGQSPFDRHTYRYTPILAFILIPNILVHKVIGKLIFSFFDIFVGILIRRIISDEYSVIFQQNSEAVLNRLPAAKAKGFKEKCVRFRLPQKFEEKSILGALFWLYNPLTMVIATRGNGDSITSFFVLASIYFLLKPKNSNGQYFLAGLLHGLAIHFRLYPLAFSLSYFLYASASTSISWRTFLRPNRRQLLLVAGTLISLISLTLLFYYLYGYEFVYECYLFHLVRKDTKHNFSLYFYMQYLSSEQIISTTEKMLTFLPQLIVLLLASYNFGSYRKTMPFSIFIQSFTMVTFNPVVTSQYFVWFLAILPVCIKNIKIGMRTAIAYAVLWFLTQGAWLFPAYLLEFKGWNTFGLLWVQGVMFFAANVFILQRIILNFNVIAVVK